MYSVIYDDGYWWICKDGEKLSDLDGFIDPVSPEIIVKELNNEI